MCSEKNLSQFYVVHHKSHTDFPVSKAVKKAVLRSDASVSEPWLY